MSRPAAHQQHTGHRQGCQKARGREGMHPGRGLGRVHSEEGCTRGAGGDPRTLRGCTRATPSPALPGNQLHAATAQTSDSAGVTGATPATPLRASCLALFTPLPAFGPLPPLLLTLKRMVLANTWDTGMSSDSARGWMTWRKPPDTRNTCWPLERSRDTSSGIPVGGEGRCMGAGRGGVWARGRVKVVARFPEASACWLLQRSRYTSSGIPVEREGVKSRGEQERSEGAGGCKRPVLAGPWSKVGTPARGCLWKGK